MSDLLVYLATHALRLRVLAMMRRLMAAILGSSTERGAIVLAACATMFVGDVGARSGEHVRNGHVSARQGRKE